MSTGQQGLNYGVRSFDLTQARTNERVSANAEEITILRADDTVSLRIGSQQAAPIPLRQLESIKIPEGVQQLYLTNSSGTGELLLLFGVSGVDASAGGSEIEGTVDVDNRAAREIGKARVQDSGGVLIDPATETSLTSVQPRSVNGTSIKTSQDSGTGAGNAAFVQLGEHRKTVDIHVDTNGSATLTVEVTPDGNTFRELDTVSYSSATQEIEQYSTAYEGIRAYLNQNRNLVEVSAKGV